MVAIDTKRRRPESNSDAGVAGLKVGWWEHEGNSNAKEDSEASFILDEKQVRKAREDVHPFSLRTAPFYYCSLCLHTLPRLLQRSRSYSTFRTQLRCQFFWEATPDHWALFLFLLSPSIWAPLSQHRVCYDMSVYSLVHKSRKKKKAEKKLQSSLFPTRVYLAHNKVLLHERVE